MAKPNKPVISVIIPMYNTQEYIGECLTSLLNQTQKNFEVIVVDDCSTDKSLARAEDMQPAFESRNLKLVTATLSKNTGRPGIPRNFGIDLAKGKYVCFVDSDDFLDANVLENFYRVAEDFKADIVGAVNILRYMEVDGEFKNQLWKLERGIFINDTTLETFDLAKRMADLVVENYSNSSCNKLYRRDFLLKNNIKFPIISFTEDSLFTFQAVVCAKNYVRIPFVGYHYRRREGSITTTKQPLGDFWVNLVDGFDFLENFMRKQKFFIENRKYRYLAFDGFYQKFALLAFKNAFFKIDVGAHEVFDFCCRKIFNRDPQKNVPLIAYLFTKLNFYKLSARKQAEEIAQLNESIKRGENYGTRNSDNLGYHSNV